MFDPASCSCGNLWSLSAAAASSAPVGGEGMLSSAGAIAFSEDMPARLELLGEPTKRGARCDAEIVRSRSFEVRPLQHEDRDRVIGAECSCVRFLLYPSTMPWASWLQRSREVSSRSAILLSSRRQLTAILAPRYCPSSDSAQVQRAPHNLIPANALISLRPDSRRLAELKGTHLAPGMSCVRPPRTRTTECSWRLWPSPGM